MYTKENLLALFQSNINIDTWTNFLKDLVPNRDLELRHQIEQLPPDTTIDEGYYLGRIIPSDDKNIGLFYFTIKDSNVKNKVVGLRSLVKQYINPRYGDFYSALVVFANQNDTSWRLSLVCDMEEEKTSFKRFTFLFGDPTNYYNTAVERFLHLKDSPICFSSLKDAFSVEALTKQFYKDLFSWYEWAVSDTTISFPTTDDKDTKETKIIRLITRLMFVWFIKQKDLVPDKIFNTQYLQSILKDFDPNSPTSYTYYNAILQNLFFATLNQEKDKRKLFTTFQGKSSYFTNKQFYRDSNSSYFTFSKEEREQKIMDIFKDIPYLNGGLFECLDNYDIYLDENETDEKKKWKWKSLHKNDGFSHRTDKENQAHIPNSFFFGEKKDKQNRKEGILEIFAHYNFTIEENTPNEQQIALDPELLGKVFENLLGAYNPETKETARNSTGSFYTPREIVSYMVDECLKNYLGNTPIVQSLFLDDDNFQEDTQQKEEYLTIAKKLFELKVLDPACGSGAFPMGLLNRMVDILEKIDPKKTTYQLKLQIIENCIYGIDIQNIAIQISKLRFFISLICDCDKDSNKDNYGIDPLPNLETKFIAANSLRYSFFRSRNIDSGIFDEKIKEKYAMLEQKRSSIIGVRTADAKRNNKIDDRKLCKEIQEIVCNDKNVIKPNEQKIKLLEKEIEKNKKELEKYTKEVWVDRNIREQQSLFDDKSKPTTIFSEDINEKKRNEIKSKINHYSAEIKKELEKTNINHSELEQAIEQVTNWNPYDQNAVSPFLDIEWMFGVKDGFDIVIGNPPYIQLQNNSGELANLYQDCSYKSFSRMGDIYCLFYERAYQLLRPKGLCCYITSNKWLRSGYGEGLRGFFAKDTNPLRLIDFGGQQIFQSATVDTNILIYQKDTNQHHTLCTAVKTTDKDLVLSNLTNYIQENHITFSFDSSDTWVILSPIEQSIKQKIESKGTPLKDWDININYGIKTGYNDAFIISTDKRNEILSRCTTDDERQRTADLIRPILRGRDIRRYSYDWADLWLIGTHNGLRKDGKVVLQPIDINDYPAVKQHLDLYWERIKRRDDQGITPYNLRNCAYWEDFSKPKIVYQELTQGSCFALDNKGEFMIANTAYLITGDNLQYLIKLLNSNYIEFIYKYFYATMLGKNGIRWLRQNIEKLPIPLFTNTKLQQQIVDAKETDDIESLIYSLYELSKDEIEFIEQSN